MSGVEASRRESVALLALTDPKQNGNALTVDLLEQILAALASWTADCERDSLEGPRALVLYSTSERAFSVGMDLEVFASASQKAGPEDRFLEVSRLYSQTLEALYRFPAPVICSLEKPVRAGGLGLALASDFVFAARETVFSLGEALFGLIPANLMPYLLLRVSPRQANRMVYTAESLSAEEAFARGLIDAAPAEDRPALRKRIKGTLRSILRCGPDALRLQKRFMADLLSLDFPDRQEAARTTLAECLRNSQVSEAVSRFFDGQLAGWCRKPPKEIFNP